MSELLIKLWDSGTIQKGIWETVYMTFVSAFFSYLIGLPLGILLNVTAKDGIHPMPWLYRIVTNACLDALRRRRDTPREAPAEPRFDGLVSAEARVALRELDALLAALPPQERAALVLVAVEGLPAKEAALALGCSEGAVEQRLVRARAALRARQTEKEAPHA